MKVIYKMFRYFCFHVGYIVVIELLASWYRDIVPKIPFNKTIFLNIEGTNVEDGWK
jgi:hypothetical protein